MSSREFAEWFAFYRLEPFGEERGDLRAGIVAATVANVNRDPKQRPRPWTPQEFMPLVEASGRGPDESEEGPEPGEVWAKFKAWAVAAGGASGQGPDESKIQEAKEETGFLGEARFQESEKEETGFLGETRFQERGDDDAAE